MGLEGQTSSPIQEGPALTRPEVKAGAVGVDIMELDEPEALSGEGSEGLEETRLKPLPLKDDFLGAELLLMSTSF